MTTRALVSFAELRAQPAWDHAAFRRDVRAGRWRCVRRGIYTRAAPPDTPEAAAKESARAAIMVLVDPYAAISHGCAALEQQLPVLAVPRLATLTVTRSGSRIRGGSAVAVASLPPAHVGVIDGVRVTTIPRTVVDLARADRRAGIVAADHALRWAADAEALVQQLGSVMESCAGWPGVTGARDVVAWADPRAESPLESMMRLLCHDHALPIPEPQVWFTGVGWSYRVDAVLRAEGVIIECDGRMKFRTAPLPGAVADLDDRVWQDEKRLWRLAECGWVVVRLTWQEIVVQPDLGAARIRAGIARARRLRSARQHEPTVVVTNPLTA